MKKYGLTHRQVKSYVDSYIDRMRKVCNEINRDYKYGYDGKTLIEGLYAICEEREKKRYNKFTTYFMDLIYIAYVYDSGAIRCGIEHEFLNRFYNSLGDGFIKDLCSLKEEDVADYVERTIHDSMDYIKLEINSIRHNDIKDNKKIEFDMFVDEIFSLAEDGECKYFTYDVVDHFYDEFIKNSRDYLTECVKETLSEGLKVYRNKEKIYDYYTNGRGREIVVKSEQYKLENPFERYKETFRKLEQNNFSEFRHNEYRLLAEMSREGVER